MLFDARSPIKKLPGPWAPGQCIGSQSLLTINLSFTMRLGSISTSGHAASTYGFWVSLIALLYAKQAGAQVQCGTQGHNLFLADGHALFQAVRCFLYDNTRPGFCTSDDLPPLARGSKATIQAYYGSAMNDWCTGDVTTFENLFAELLVRRRRFSFSRRLFRCLP